MSSLAVVSGALALSNLALARHVASPDTAILPRQPAADISEEEIGARTIVVRETEDEDPAPTATFAPSSLDDEIDDEVVDEKKGGGGSGGRRGGGSGGYGGGGTDDDDDEEGAAFKKGPLSFGALVAFVGTSLLIAAAF